MIVGMLSTNVYTFNPKKIDPMTGLKLLKKPLSEVCEKCAFFRKDLIKDYFDNLDPNIGFCSKFFQAISKDENVCHYFELPKVEIPKPTNPQVTQTSLF